MAASLLPAARLPSACSALSTQHFRLETLEPRVLLDADPSTLLMDGADVSMGSATTAATGVVHDISGTIADGSLWKAGDIYRITADARVAKTQL